MIEILRVLDETLEKMKPIASVVGMGSVVKLADTILAVGTSVLENYKTGSIVISSEDAAEIEIMLKRVQDENDALHDKINAA